MNVGKICVKELFSTLLDLTCSHKCCCISQRKEKEDEEEVEEKVKRQDKRKKRVFVPKYVTRTNVIGRGEVQ